MKVVTKIISTEVKSIDEKKRIIWHPISVEVRDRMGDIVRIDGIDVENFKKKPTVFYGHNYTGYDPLPVVGENVGFVKDGKKLLAGTKFLGPDDGLSGKLSDLVNDLWALNKRKLVGWSVGFIPLETADLKEDGRTVGHDFKKSELLEYSNVLLPANQEAVNNMIKTGIISKDFADPYRVTEQLRKSRQPDFKSLIESINKYRQEIQNTNRVLMQSLQMERFHYREVGEDKVNPDSLRLSKRLLEYCKWVLGLPGLRIQWIVKCGPGEGKPFVNPILGQAETDGNTILIRADSGISNIRTTIPHEAHHQWMRRKHGSPQNAEELEFWEATAENFTAKIWGEIRKLYQEEDGYIYWPR